MQHLDTKNKVRVTLKILNSRNVNSKFHSTVITQEKHNTVKAYISLKRQNNKVEYKFVTLDNYMCQSTEQIQRQTENKRDLNKVVSVSNLRCSEHQPQ